jgi:hypothetical protein
MSPLLSQTLPSKCIRLDFIPGIQQISVCVVVVLKDTRVPTGGYFDRTNPVVWLDAVVLANAMAASAVVVPTVPLGARGVGRQL